jgi:hypothetical protein
VFNFRESGTAGDNYWRVFDGLLNFSSPEGARLAGLGGWSGSPQVPLCLEMFVVVSYCCFLNWIYGYKDSFRYWLAIMGKLEGIWGDSYSS